MKMNYLKIRADFKYATKGRFYRIFLVKEDIGLGELGELMVDIFGGTMEHFFMYHTKEKAYIPSSWMEQWDSFGSSRNEPFKDKTIKDLPEKFIFVYDTGDGWDFDCKIYRRKHQKFRPNHICANDAEKGTRALVQSVETSRRRTWETHKRRGGGGFKKKFRHQGAKRTRLCG